MMMHITIPETVESVLWEGVLEVSAVAYSTRTADIPSVTIGQPTVWKAAEAFESKTEQKWVPPLGEADYWLVQLSCTLRKPEGRARYVEARQVLTLRPQNFDADKQSVYAFSLHPERLGAEDKVNQNVQLGPELKFASAQVKAGQVGASIEYRKVFPVIQAYGVGESDPYWEFRAHESFPLEGSQSVFAVIVSKPESKGVRAEIDLMVTMESKFGSIRYGTTRETAPFRRFSIPLE